MHCAHAGKGGGETRDSFILPFKQEHEQTQPGGGLLLGLLTILTTHHVNADENERRNKPKCLNNPTTIYNKPKKLMRRVYYAPLPLLLAGEKERIKWQLHSAKRSLAF